jgi:hypothetical protein
MWSATAYSRVLAVRASRNGKRGGREFDTRSAEVRILRRGDIEHVLIDRGGEPVRLDVTNGTLAAGASIHFDVADDDRLEGQLSAIRHFRGIAPPVRHTRLAGRIQALHAVDARDAGASLREIAELLLGPGDWPGDGEHRKSLVRRLIASGDAMVRAGPLPILKLS